MDNTQDWFAQSLMARRGVNRGKVGVQHMLDEARQGKYHYVYGAFVEPVLHVEPGAVVTVETQDAFEGKLRTEQDSPSACLTFPFLNPQNGPIHVQGAEKGDCLAVYIREMRPRGSQPCGTTALMPEFGGLVATADTALLHAPWPERVVKVNVTAEEGARWNDRITLPYEPFIGTIGVAPEIEAISSIVPDYYGGNMDLPDMAPGDGELCGVAIEHPTTTTVQIDLIKGWSLRNPWLENARFYMSIGSAKPMEDAARRAYRDLVRWLAEDFGTTEEDAYLLLTQAGRVRVRVGNMVDPKYTLGASILKSIVGLAQ